MPEAVDSKNEVLLAHFQELVRKDVAVPVAAMDALAGVIKSSDNVCYNIKQYVFFYDY